MCQIIIIILTMITCSLHYFLFGNYLQAMFLFHAYDTIGPGQHLLHRHLYVYNHTILFYPKILVSSKSSSYLIYKCWPYGIHTPETLTIMSKSLLPWDTQQKTFIVTSSNEICHFINTFPEVFLIRQ